MTDAPVSSAREPEAPTPVAALAAVNADLRKSLESATDRLVEIARKRLEDADRYGRMLAANDLRVLRIAEPEDPGHVRA